MYIHDKRPFTNYFCHVLRHRDVRWGGGGGGPPVVLIVTLFYNVIVEDQAVQSTVYWNTR